MEYLEFLLFELEGFLLNLYAEGYGQATTDIYNCISAFPISTDRTNIIGGTKNGGHVIDFCSKKIKPLEDTE